MDADALLLAARAARRARAYDEAQRALEKYQQVRGLDDAGSLEELLLSAERDVEQVVDACRQYVEIPDKYRAVETSGLTYKVEKGTQTHDITLE